MVSKKTSDKPQISIVARITKWECGYTAHAVEEAETDECFNFDFEIELEDPVRGVKQGSLIVYGSPSSCGGTIHYDSDLTLHGCVWLGLNGAVALSSLLAAGVVPRLVLWGGPFHRREARIRDVSWYTPGHPEVVED